MAVDANESDGCGPSKHSTVCNVNGTYWNMTASQSDYDERFGMYLHPHWKANINQIDSASFALICGFGVFITVVCLIGVIGNALVIFIFSKTVGLRTPSNLLIINLAVSDLAFAFICGFPLMSLASFERRWKWGNTGCHCYGFMAAVFGLNSINSLACISVDRYLVISRPLKMLQNTTKTRSIKMIAACWAWSLVWATPPLLGWSDYVGEGFQVSCTFDYLTLTKANIIYNHCLVVFEFVVPVTVIVLSYAGIMFSVSRHSADLRVDPLEPTARNGIVTIRRHQDKELFEQEIQLAKVSAAMVSLFILSWLPYTIVSQLAINGYQEYVTPFVAQFPVLLAKSSAVWNPIVYSLTHPRYQAAVAARLPEPFKSLFCRKVLLKNASLRFTSVTTQSGRSRRENQASDSNWTDQSIEGSLSTPNETNVKLAQNSRVSTVQLTTTTL